MKGGARARSGPAPDLNALRRDRKDDSPWTQLPASGRQGPAPDWPLSPRATRREAQLWAKEWARPQAIEWERLGLAVEVGLYIRTLAAAEKPDAPVNARTLVKQLLEDLGLTLNGLAKNRWTIEGGERQVTATVPAVPRSTTRQRLKLVVGGEG